MCELQSCVGQVCVCEQVVCDKLRLYVSKLCVSCVV